MVEIWTLRVAIVADGDVMETSRVEWPLGDAVKRSVEESDRWVALGGGLLVDEGGKGCPERRRGAGALGGADSAIIIHDLNGVRTHGNVWNIAIDA